MKNGVITLYGIDGKRLGNYTLAMVGSWDLKFAFQSPTGGANPPQQTWFAGRPVTAVDRVGSRSTGGRFTPYGVEVTPTANDAEKFATYYRDQKTWLDYAMQRYYQSGVGRFLTPDPYRAGGGTTEPQSWNRYACVHGDPLNYGDPQGRDRCSWDPDNNTLNCSIKKVYYPSPFPIPPMGGSGDPLCDAGNCGGNGFPESDLIGELVMDGVFTEYNKEFRGRTAEAIRNLNSNCQNAVGSSLSSAASKASELTFFDTRRRYESSLT